MEFIMLLTRMMRIARHSSGMLQSNRTFFGVRRRSVQNLP